MEQALLAIGDVKGEDAQKTKHGKRPGKPDFFTYEELQRMAAIPDRRTKAGIRDYAVLLVFSETPARRGEVCQMRRNNLVDEGENNKYLFYRMLKKRGDKPVYQKMAISESTYEAIKRYIDLDPNIPGDAPLFFTLGTRGTDTSHPITPWALHMIVDKYVKLAGIKKRVSPHSFRKTWVDIRKDKYDIFTLRDGGGWESVQMVLTYVDDSKEKLREAALAYPVGK